MPSEAATVLVAGGAGYVGSHVVRALIGARFPVVVADDLSTGHRTAVPPTIPFVEIDVGDPDLVASAIREHGVGSVIHLASRINVGESVANPRKYWHDNLTSSMSLLDAALDSGVRKFVFSSTAAVYGDPARTPIDEDHPERPVNPYGETKLAVERMLAGYERAYGLRWAALRYFNAAGAEPGHGLGERHEPETHLIPLAIAAAFGGAPLTVFGCDFATPDGTCVRDYVHVSDLADAHVAALSQDARGPLNLGSGRGHSVTEVIHTVERLSGQPVERSFGPRRPGDPPVLVAAPDRAAAILGWRARRDFDTIVRDALAFYRAGIPAGEE